MSLNIKRTPMLNLPFKLYGNFSTRSTNTFPIRRNTIQKLNNSEYESLANDFNSYGTFINYCISDRISTKSSQRKEVLLLSFKTPISKESNNKNIDINDTDYSDTFWKWHEKPF